MRTRPLRTSRAVPPATLLLAIAAACGADAPYDWKNREIPWTYGPTNATATAEHLAGTGKKGPAAVAKGWKVRLEEGKQLSLQPYELAGTHDLFGKVTLSLALFDQRGQQLAVVSSPPVTATNASFKFEITEDVGKQLNDVVIWYVGS